MNIDEHIIDHEMLGLGAFGVLGRALIAKQTAESSSIPTTPTTFIWPTAANTNPDLQYDPVTGYLTFKRDGFFWSNASWRVFGTTNRQVFADAEFSLDGGNTWTRGADSGREESASTTGRSLQFPFAGHYPAGTMLRFMFWASGTGVTIQSSSRDGSGFPSSRLTTVHINGTRRA